MRSDIEERCKEAKPVSQDTFGGLFVILLAIFAASSSSMQIIFHLVRSVK